MPERRFNDDEVAAIFRVATEGGDSQMAPSAERGDGLTLTELQSIASEVGISQDAVTRAAQSLEAPQSRTELQLPDTPERFLGLPIAVSRNVPLPRPLTDSEWEILVSELRQVFRAHGRIGASGSMREWSNGNLHALLETTLTGYQLRLGTMKTNARLGIATGVAGVVTSGGFVTAALAMGQMRFMPTVVYMTLGVSAVLLYNGTVGLARWARRRREQMAMIADRVLLLTEKSS